MKHSLHRRVVITAVSGGLVGLITSAAGSGPASLVEVELGTASFAAVTNMPGIEVKGKSSALSARVDVSRDGTNGLVLEQIEASLPVKSLATGMKVRDEHMRKYIFTGSDGQEPDLRFSAGKGACSGAGTGHEFTCQVAGSLSLRGISRPLNLSLNVKEQSGSTRTFRTSGDGVVKLSDYGIEPPSQFGVKPANEVKFHLEFTGKQKSAVISTSGGLP